jgi:hypothetical protein
MTKRFLQMLLMGLAILSLASGVHAGYKMNICHKDMETISIDSSAWPAHKKHGDLWGSCDRYKKYSVNVIFRCGVSATGGGLVVTMVSSSVDIPIAVPTVVVEDNCADANALLMDLRFDLKNVTSGPVGSDFETEYLYSREYLNAHRPN